MTKTIVALSFALAVFAASSQVARAEATAEAADAAPAQDPMAFVRGAQKWGNTCARCHGMRDAKEFDDAQWQVIVTHMRARAGLTGADSADILRFLQQSN
jgi:cytochrome c553